MSVILTKKINTHTQYRKINRGFNILLKKFNRPGNGKGEISISLKTKMLALKLSWINRYGNLEILRGMKLKKKDFIGSEDENYNILTHILSMMIPTPSQQSRSAHFVAQKHV